MKKFTPAFLLLFLLSALLLSSCRQGPLNGYKKITPTYGYKMVQDADTGTAPGTGKFMLAFASVRNDQDSLLDDPYFGDPDGFSLQVNMRTPVQKSDLMTMFQMLSDGDSVVVKMVADTFFTKFNMNRELPPNVRSGSYVTLSVRVIDLMNEEEYDQWLQTKETQDKAAAYQLFRDYLNTAGVTEEPVGSGIVMVNEREGKGAYPQFGNTALIHYMMITFGGRELANTYTSNQPYEFTIGSNEVVYGLNEAMLKMKKGGKSRIYIPYYLAYGKDGVPGIVEPYTHLVLDVELLDVRK